MKTHLMLDLETLDTIDSAVVISFGAVIFNKRSILEKYYTPLHIFPQLIKGRTISQDTLDFWKQQDDAAQNIGVSVRSNQTSLQLFINLATHYEALGEIKVWGKGPHFDVTIIESLMRDYKLKPPWKFWNIRDVRTFMDYVPTKDLKLEGTKHNALDDALYQAKIIQKSLKKGQ